MQAAMAEGAFWMNTSTQTTNPLKKRRVERGLGWPRELASKKNGMILTDSSEKRLSTYGKTWLQRLFFVWWICRWICLTATWDDIWYMPMSMCWCVFQQLKLPEENTVSRVCPIVVFRWKNMQSGWEWLLGKADISFLFAQQSGMI